MCPSFEQHWCCSRPTAWIWLAVSSQNRSDQKLSGVRTVFSNYRKVPEHISTNASVVSEEYERFELNAVAADRFRGLTNAVGLRLLHNKISWPGFRLEVNWRLRGLPPKLCTNSLWTIQRRGVTLAVAPLWCLAVLRPEGSTRARILPGCPSLESGTRVAEVGFEPRTLWPVNSRSKHRSISPVVLITVPDVA
ncbi:hypothetical protein CSKR_104058 [Clonorchis sinensis]|uniref:Uncharacterized protein n=1 Tax=Clonorchis sinensis TaxID=79923 RepID=A0A419QAV6_CLOSI|nr:hypothetical protein CSKR_104058 [Clonorchis sinensis]